MIIDTKPGLLIQIKQRKHQSNVWNLFKLNNKDARIQFEIPNEFSVLESWLGIFAKFRIENQLTGFYSGFYIAFYDWHLMGWAAFFQILRFGGKYLFKSEKIRWSIGTSMKIYQKVLF